MDEMILKFLKAYKKLDELCKQVLSSDRGISEYIDQMQSEGENCSKIHGWNSDLKRLKRMRWMRNQLVHDADSFDTLKVTKEDISYLKEFRSRILNCEDPFSLLYNSKKSSNNIGFNEPVFCDVEEDDAFENSNDEKIQQILKVFLMIITISVLIGLFLFFLN